MFGRGGDRVLSSAVAALPSRQSEELAMRRPSALGRWVGV